MELVHNKAVRNNHPLGSIRPLLVPYNPANVPYLLDKRNLSNNIRALCRRTSNDRPNRPLIYVSTDPPPFI